MKYKEKLMQEITIRQNTLRKLEGQISHESLEHYSYEWCGICKAGLLLGIISEDDLLQLQE